MCEFCRVKDGICGDIEADNPTSLLYHEGDLAVDLTLLNNALHLNIDIRTFEDGEWGDYMSWKWLTADINYCPMCGRKLAEPETRIRLAIHEILELLRNNKGMVKESVLDNRGWPSDSAYRKAKGILISREIVETSIREGEVYLILSSSKEATNA